MGRTPRISLVATLTLAITLIAAPSAVGSSGEISRAVANSTWTKGSVAGSVDWTGCEHSVPLPSKPPVKPGPGDLEEPWQEELAPPPYCGWIPFATVGPGSDPAQCNTTDRRWPDGLGEGVTLAWVGLERRDVGTTEFDVSAIPLDGGSEQLVCLSVIEIAPEGVACAQVVGVYCPPYVMARFPRTLASASLVSQCLTHKKCAKRRKGAKHRRCRGLRAAVPLQDQRRRG